jgi:hypothetical protein
MDEASGEHIHGILFYVEELWIISEIASLASFATLWHGLPRSPQKRLRNAL